MAVSFTGARLPQMLSLKETSAHYSTPIIYCLSYYTKAFITKCVKKLIFHNSFCDVYCRSPQIQEKKMHTLYISNTAFLISGGRVAVMLQYEMNPFLIPATIIIAKAVANILYIPICLPEQIPVVSSGIGFQAKGFQA